MMLVAALTILRNDITCSLVARHFSGGAVNFWKDLGGIAAESNVAEEDA